MIVTYRLRAAYAPASPTAIVRGSEVLPMRGYDYLSGSGQQGAVECTFTAVQDLSEVTAILSSRND